MTDLEINFQIYILLMVKMGVKRLQLYPINLHSNMAPPR
jgi:hypothetical protein